jgi:hypothetical protein
MPRETARSPSRREGSRTSGSTWACSPRRPAPADDSNASATALRGELDLARNLGSVFGKILRIHPLGSNGTNGRYGVPADNPYAQDGVEPTLGEIWASRFRNPQGFDWDVVTDDLLVADIGQSVVEELSLVRRERTGDGTPGRGATDPRARRASTRPSGAGAVDHVPGGPSSTNRNRSCKPSWLRPVSSSTATIARRSGLRSRS